MFKYLRHTSKTLYEVTRCFPTDPWYTNEIISLVSHECFKVRDEMGHHPILRLNLRWPVKIQR